MGHIGGVGYWRKRLSEDSYKLDDRKKIGLTRALLMYQVPLQPDEADMFLNTDINSMNSNEKSRYSIIEKKVSDAYSGVSEINDPNQRTVFLAEFRNILQGFYTKEELDENISYMTDGEHLAVGWLVGATHPSFRKIRNAYLPAIVTVKEIGQSAVSDITSQVFSGEGDAVSKIERLVSGN